MVKTIHFVHSLPFKSFQRMNFTNFPTALPSMEHFANVKTELNDDAVTVLGQYGQTLPHQWNNLHATTTAESANASGNGMAALPAALFMGHQKLELPELSTTSANGSNLMPLDTCFDRLHLNGHQSDGGLCANGIGHYGQYARADTAPVGMLAYPPPDNENCVVLSELQRASANNMAQQDNTVWGNQQQNPGLEFSAISNALQLEPNSISIPFIGATQNNLPNVIMRTNFMTPQTNSPHFRPFPTDQQNGQSPAAVWEADPNEGNFGDGLQPKMEFKEIELPIPTMTGDSNEAIKPEAKKTAPKKGRGRHGGEGADKRGQKPPETYIEMIAMAIQAQPNQQANLTQIYDFIYQHIYKFNDKFFGDEYKGWQNSIRHNLSLKEYFKKIPKSPNGKKMGKGLNWTFGDNYSYSKIVEEKQKKNILERQQLLTHLDKRDRTSTTKSTSKKSKKRKSGDGQKPVEESQRNYELPSTAPANIPMLANNHQTIVANANANHMNTTIILQYPLQHQPMAFAHYWPSADANCMPFASLNEQAQTFAGSVPESVGLSNGEIGEGNVLPFMPSDWTNYEQLFSYCYYGYTGDSWTTASFDNIENHSADYGTFSSSSSQLMCQSLMEGNGVPPAMTTTTTLNPFDASMNTPPQTCQLRNQMIQCQMEIEE